MLQGTPLKALRELYLGLLTELTEGIFPNLACQYENLYTLDLGGTNVAVTDNAMQLIFRHMVSLRFLNVDSCSKVNHKTFNKIFILQKIIHLLDHRLWFHRSSDEKFRRPAFLFHQKCQRTKNIEV